jgi:3-hydroxyisobutyrate dehydrogenase-like beta-hydroxyacid dehydrogenase
MFGSTRKIVGGIGLGIIGRAVSANLRQKGFQVFVWNRTPRPVPNFVGSPAELAELCDFLEIFVSDDEALLATVERLSEKLRSRHIVIAHSTVAPDSMRAAAEIVGRRSARFVEAPFTGSKVGAENGELVYYVGGSDAALRNARPVLEASGKQIIKIGEIGQATAIKIATNMVTAASVQAAAEALALVRALGLPFDRFVEAMQGNASYSTTLAMKVPKMFERNFEPHFSVKHMLKDMKIANQLGVSHNLDLGVTAAARDQLLEQMQWGHGDDDYSAVARKYLPDTPSIAQEETQTATPDAQAEAGSVAPALEPTTSLAGLAEPKSKQENGDSATGDVAVSTSPSRELKEKAQLRRGFLSQLLRRGRQLLKQPVSKEE